MGTVKYKVNLYKGCTKMIVVPLAVIKEPFMAEMAWYRIITDMKDMRLIGETVFEAVGYARENPVDKRTEQQRKDDMLYKIATRYKVYPQFNRKYLLCDITYYPDGSVDLLPTHRIVGGKGYAKEPEDTIMHLPSGTTAEEIGNAVTECVAYMKTLPENAPPPPLEMFYY